MQNVCFYRLHVCCLYKILYTRHVFNKFLLLVHLYLSLLFFKNKQIRKKPLLNIKGEIHSDTLSLFRQNQSIALLNAAFLVEWSGVE